MKRLILIPILALVASLSSCTYKFDEYNTDSNRVEYGEIMPMNLMEHMLFTSADGYLYRTYRINGELIQYTVMTGTTDEFHRYVFPNNDYQNAWNHLARWAAHADHMYDLAVEQEDVNCQAIALTLRAMYMCDLISLFGDAPFTEAFQGAEGVTQPVFDTQEEIFPQLIADLQWANLAYDTSLELDNSSKDLLYEGDLTKWRKFTNSLLARIVMRLNNVMPDQAKEIMGAMAADASTYPIFTSNDDQAIFKFSGDEPNVNRFGSDSESSFTTLNRKAAENIVNIMTQGSGDPRLGYYFTSSGEYSGVVSGESYADTSSSSSGAAYLNKDVLGDYDSPYCFMPYSEVMFLFAEAAKLGYISAGDESVVKAYYDAGVTGSIQYWSGRASIAIPDSEIEAFLTQTYFAYNDTYERIMEQKYISQFWVGYEAYHDYRRTGYPTLTIGSKVSNSGVMPTRFCYPEITKSSNPTNYSNAVARMGGDDMLTKLWWAK